MNMIYKGMLAALIVASGSAFAADSTVTINGKVTAAACTVDNSGAYTVTMDDVTAATLSTAGSYAASWKNFSVTLSGCPAGTTKVTATFSGTPHTSDANKYANSTGAGFAQNVAVQVQNATANTDMGPGKTMTVNVDGSNKATFGLKARPYSPLGGATVGNITTVMTLDFNYN